VMWWFRFRPRFHAVRLVSVDGKRVCEGCVIGYIHVHVCPCACSCACVVIGFKGLEVGVLLDLVVQALRWDQWTIVDKGFAMTVQGMDRQWIISPGLSQTD
jgi:hypothetical protein